MADNPDMALAVRFYTKAVENPRKSKEAGRPIFENREFIQIRFPADNKREHHAPADEMHYVSHERRQMTYAERFPAVYRAFKEDQVDIVDGTPLAEMPALNEAQRAEFRAQKIQTVEQLAQLPDSSIKRLGMGARPAVEAAQAYLAQAAGLGEVAALRARIAELESKASAPASDIEAEFAHVGEEDLRNMLTQAGVEADGRWGRNRLEAEVRKLAAEKAEVA